MHGGKCYQLPHRNYAGLPCAGPNSPFHAPDCAWRFHRFNDVQRSLMTASDRDGAERALEAFAETWDERYPMISASWIEHWERILPFLAFPPELRRAVYTTNTIEALNRQIRKIIKTRGSFPTEDSARKLLYLAITRAQRKWRHTYNWIAALAAFRIHFGERLRDNVI
jgi:putative transposase